MDTYLSFRYLEGLCGNDLKNYTVDKDFRRWTQKSLFNAQCCLLVPEGQVLVNDSFENRQDGPMVYSLHEGLKKKPTAKELAALDSMSHVDLLDAVAIVVLEEYLGKELIIFSHYSLPYSR